MTPLNYIPYWHRHSSLKASWAQVWVEFSKATDCPVFSSFYIIHPSNINIVHCHKFVYQKGPCFDQVKKTGPITWRHERCMVQQCGTTHSYHQFLLIAPWLLGHTDHAIPPIHFWGNHRSRLHIYPVLLKEKFHGVLPEVFGRQCSQCRHQILRTDCHSPNNQWLTS